MLIHKKLFLRDTTTLAALSGLLFFAGAFRILALASSPIHIQGDLAIYRFEPNQVYLVESDIHVPPGKKVELPSGVIFFFADNTKLEIAGGFSVAGTDSVPIIFTSINDPVYHMAGDSTMALPYSWMGIRITETSSNTLIQDVMIKYADTPLVSRGQGILLKNIKRSETKLESFIIGNEKYSVKSNQPFDFPSLLSPTTTAAKHDTAPSPPSVTMESRVGATPPVAVAPLKTKTSITKKTGLKYSLGCTSGLAFCVAGAFFIKAKSKKDDFDEESRIYNDFLHPIKDREAALIAANTYKKEGTRSNTNGTISSIIGAILLCGLGLSIMF
jgi:hypothetical protein